MICLLKYKETDALSPSMCPQISGYQSFPSLKSSVFSGQEISWHRKEGHVKEDLYVCHAIYIIHVYPLTIVSLLHVCHCDVSHANELTCDHWDSTHHSKQLKLKSCWYFGFFHKCLTWSWWFLSCVPNFPIRRQDLYFCPSISDNIT